MCVNLVLKILFIYPGMGVWWKCAWFACYVTHWNIINMVPFSASMSTHGIQERTCVIIGGHESGMFLP